MALDPDAVGLEPGENSVIVCVSAWIEDHPSPLRVVVRVLGAHGSMTTTRSASIDATCAEVRRALNALDVRRRPAPP